MSYGADLVNSHLVRFKVMIKKMHILHSSHNSTWCTWRNKETTNIPVVTQPNGHHQNTSLGFSSSLQINVPTSWAVSHTHPFGCAPFPQEPDYKLYSVSICKAEGRWERDIGRQTYVKCLWALPWICPLLIHHSAKAAAISKSKLRA